MKAAKTAENRGPKEKKAFEKFLSDDEELVMATGFSKNYMRHRFAYYLLWPGGVCIALGAGLAYIFQFNLGIGILLGTILASIWSLILSSWHYHANRYLLTTRRVIIKKGLVSVKLISALYDKITHIEVDQGIIDRLVMKHGDIIVNTAGGNKDEIRILSIDNPIQFKNLLERLINRERERFGGQSGPVVTLEGELVDPD
ncbi:PH domain-containing protein [Candidatus Daviesbacteria bacterium]|nr:PH domain-containing protein [Candidatus Daviesbacteria bacterium]